MRFLVQIGCLLLAVSPAAARAQSRYLFVHHINVGQGDATLFVSPTGRTMLVDGGNPGQGNGTILPLLRTLGIGQLDFVVVSHYDRDHIGGVDEVLQAMRPFRGTVFDRGDPPVDATDEYVDYVAAAGTSRRTMTVDQSVDLGGGVTVRCVAVNGDVTGGARQDLPGTSENDASLALLVQFADFEYFVGGDLTGGSRRSRRNVENLVANAIGNIDVVRLNHHGSNTSSTAEFLHLLDPEVAVISVGVHRGFRHPSRQVLDRLLAQPSLNVVFQTQRGATRGGLTARDLELVRVADSHVILWATEHSYGINGMVFPVDRP